MLLQQLVILLLQSRQLRLDLLLLLQQRQLLLHAGKLLLDHGKAPVDNLLLRCLLLL
jgi:hypothetical protein